MADEKTWYDRISDAWKSLVFRYSSEEVEYTREEKEAIVKWHIENENWNELRKMMESYSNVTPAFSALADAAEKGFDVSMFLKDMIECSTCQYNSSYSSDMECEVSRAIYYSVCNGIDISSFVTTLVGLLRFETIEYSPQKELFSGAVIIHHVNKGEWKEIMEYLGSNSEPLVQMADYGLNLFMRRLIISVHDDPHVVLTEIKKYTAEVRKVSGSRRTRAKFISKFSSLTQEIYDKMNTNDKDKKFPVKHQQIRTVRKKVITNG